MNTYKKFKITFGICLSIIMIIIIIIIGLFTIRTNDRYRILIINDSGKKVTVSMYYYNDEKEKLSFEQLFEKGEKKMLDNEERLNIYGSDYPNFNKFWIGASEENGVPKQIWQMDDGFENYSKALVDFSEGLRIDYILTLDGKIKKEYWR